MIPVTRRSLVRRAHASTIGGIATCGTVGGGGSLMLTFMSGEEVNVTGAAQEIFRLSKHLSRIMRKQQNPVGASFCIDEERYPR